MRTFNPYISPAKGNTGRLEYVEDLVSRRSIAVWRSLMMMTRVPNALTELIGPFRGRDEIAAFPCALLTHHKVPCASPSVAIHSPWACRAHCQ